MECSDVGCNAFPSGILYADMWKGECECIQEMKLSGIRRYAAMRGWNVSVLAEDESRPASLVRYLAEKPPLGCIVESSAARRDLPPRLFGDVPVVYLDIEMGLYGGNISAMRTKNETRMSEREKFIRKARRAAAKTPRKVAKTASFTSDGTVWTLSNESGVRISGRVGSSSLADEVERDFRIVGRLGARIMTTAPDWPPVTRLASVEGGVDPKTGCAFAVLDGTAGEESQFSVTVRLTLAPHDTDILAEILSVKNIGDAPLSVMKVFLCPIAGDEIPPVRVPMPMNVWKGWNESHWKLFDGSRYGAVSHNESADGFNLWTEANGAQHADIPFRPKTSPVTLKPGETLAAPRPMGARLVLTPAMKN